MLDAGVKAAYEYKIVKIYGTFEEDRSITDELNDLGSGGWRVIHITDDWAIMEHAYGNVEGCRKLRAKQAEYERFLHSKASPETPQ